MAENQDIIRFVVLAAPRTGSNWLCSMLNSHPEVLCHHEIFNPEGIHYALDHRQGDLNLGTLADRAHAPLSLLERLWRQNFGKRAVGFKLNRGQDSAVFQHVLSNTEIRKVVIRRKNRIKTYVSEMVAESTGRWESYDFSASGQSGFTIKVELASLLQHIALNQRYYDEIDHALTSTRQPYLEVIYEDLMHEEEWKRILNFLDVSLLHSSLKPGTKKQNSNDLRTLISNYAEIEAALEGFDLLPELHALSF